MKELIAKHKFHWSQRSFKISAISGIVLLVFSLFLNYFANDYANRVANNSVTDLILSNTPVFNVNFIIIYGVMALIVFICVLLLVQPEKIPFVLKSIALFLIVRAIFMSLTHMAQFTPQAPLDSGPFIDFIGGGNQGGLFFSGHTGLPFLLALIYWIDKKIRLVFLGTSIILGASLLLGHLHYSIDVFGAFFITYTVFCICKKIFAKDRLIFNKGLIA